ncbi:hypothetical protein KVT40_006832 [Elsinoe batatas]|uniref:Transcription factor domain-containing protein n=1 Tax=Elsinoe batatas TaxID=2601811 RepID=A0A8K0PCY1_9PEZI|nr:hypothetical protein KVT40_006832 [Elsinoe batatas]
MAPNPGFVFVSCTGQDHKGDKRLMPRLRQHVMLHHLRAKHDERRRTSVSTLATSASSRSSDSNEDEPLYASSHADHAAQLVRKSRSKQPYYSFSATPIQEETLAVIPLHDDHATTPLGVSFDPFDALPVKGIADMGDIFHWFYSGQSDPGTHQWRNSTRYHWLDKHWELTRQSPVMFNFSLCFALEKKGIITRASQASRIFQYRSSVLAALQADLANNPTKLPGQTVATMAGLAYIALRDGEVEVATAHIRAISLLAPLDRYEMHIWLYVVWVDFRLAASTFALPYFAHYIPPECDAPLPFTPIEFSHAAHVASQNILTFPHTSPTTTQAALLLFQRLHEVCLAVNKEDIELTTLYGHLYETEHSLLTFSHRAWRAPASAANTIIKIILLAAQLSFWTSTFYVLPQGRRFNVDLHSRLLEQFSLLTHPNSPGPTNRSPPSPLSPSPPPQSSLPGAWAVIAGLPSLLWVLFIATASAKEFDASRMHLFVRLLKLTTAAMGCKTREQFETELRRFPWTRHGCERMAGVVWGEVSGEPVSGGEREGQVFWIEEMGVE